MPLAQNSMPTVQSVHATTSLGIARSPDASDGGEAKRLLQAVWWLSRKWVEPLAVSDPQRVNLIDLGILTDDLVRAGDYSAAAMADVRSLLCGHCRRLCAALDECTEQLNRCRMLKEPNH